MGHDFSAVWAKGQTLGLSESSRVCQDSSDRVSELAIFQYWLMISRAGMNKLVLAGTVIMMHELEHAVHEENGHSEGLSIFCHACGKETLETLETDHGAAWVFT